HGLRPMLGGIEGGRLMTMDMIRVVVLAMIVFLVVVVVLVLVAHRRRVALMAASAGPGSPPSAHDAESRGTRSWPLGRADAPPRPPRRGHKRPGRCWSRGWARA